MEKLVLIDGNSLINRAFYAMPIMSNRDGVFTNAVYGFLNMFFKMTSEIKPKYLAVCFDVKAPTFRHELYSEYKGTRKPSPPELHPQIDLLKKVLKTMGVACFEKAGIEADDIIGTLSKIDGVEKIIITGDRDSFQLIDESTSVYFTKRGITDVVKYTESNLKELYGVNPNEVPDLKALMGDSSDNIKGVEGVGEKTALSLINDYKSIENLYNSIDKISGKLKEKLQSGKESAFFSKTLATIKTDCDIDKDLSKTVCPYTFSAKVKDLFFELEFKSLLKNGELFENSNKEKEKTAEKEIKKTVITLLKDAPKLDKERYAFCYQGEYVCLSDGESEYAFKIRNNFIDDGEELSAILEYLRPVIYSENLIVFDKKKINRFLDGISKKPLNSNTDVSLIKYLVDFSGETDLKSTIEEYGLNLDTPASSLYSIYLSLYPKLKEQEVEDLYFNVELPLSDVLFSMEKSGFKVEENELNALGKKYKESLTSLENEIREQTCEPTLNVNSPKQLGEVLFNKLKIGKGKKTKSGYSTGADVLESLENAHPVIPLIQKYRKISKLNSTYVEGFKPLIDKTTGLIHTSFNQTVTTTGRLSSSEPNLQNIPIRDDEGKELRKFFVPKSNDRILIGADYSQIELRLLAEFSESKPLISAFIRGDDIHSETASKVFGVSIDKVSPKMRRDAKAVNFGVIYGISEYGLAKNLGISPKSAKEYIDGYFARFPEVKKYMEDSVAFARKTGYAKTFTGRRRYIREINSSNFQQRQFGERASMNMPLQGSAADVIKIAMINVFNRLKKENLKSELILQIHDELIIDAFIEEKERVEKIIKEEMENAVSFTVPLSVEVGTGKSLYEAK